MSQAKAQREWNSEAYHRLSRPQFDWGQKVLDRLRLWGDEMVGDAGCGTGKITGELLKRLPRGRVIGLDLSQNMLGKAQEHLRSKFAGQVVFTAADLQYLPLSDCILDGVFSTATFHWVPNHDLLFAGLLRVLKPGGWLEAQCGGGPNLARVRERALALMASAEYATFFAGWNAPWQYPDDVTTAERMRRAGFVQVDTWLEESPAVLSGASEYAEFLATVTLHRHIERIPEGDLRERFLHRLAALAAGDDPPFTLDYWRLNMSGKKRA